MEIGRGKFNATKVRREPKLHRKRIIVGGILKAMGIGGADLHAEHQVLISYLSSKTSSDETARVLYNVLLLASEANAPDVFTTVRYCLEDATLSREVEELLRQKATDIECEHASLAEDLVDVKYSREGRTSYDDYECDQAIKLLDALNDFFTAVETYRRVASRQPQSVAGSVLCDIPRVICRLGGAKPEARLSRQATPELKKLIEHSRSVDNTKEFIPRDWGW